MVRAAVRLRRVAIEQAYGPNSLADNDAESSPRYRRRMTELPLPQRLAHHERLELAVEACVHPRTVERVYRGEPIRSTTAARLKRAAQSLGLQLPTLHIAGAAGVR